MLSIKSIDNNFNVSKNRNVSLVLEGNQYSVGTKNYCDVNIIKGQSPFIFIDIVKNIQGVNFRSYANIENINVSFKYDKPELIANILSINSTMSIYDIFEMMYKLFDDNQLNRKGCLEHLEDDCDKLLMIRIMLNDKYNTTEAISGEDCSNEDFDMYKVLEKVRIYMQSNGETDEEINRFEEDILTFCSKSGVLFTPSGPWSDIPSYPPEYSFAENFFVEYNEDRVPILNQYLRDDLVRGAVHREYSRKGFMTRNYMFDARPEINEVLVGRFDTGGPSLSVYESKKYLEATLYRSNEWFGESSSIGTVAHRVIMDEGTVSALTPLGKVDTFENLLANVSLLNSIFGVNGMTIENGSYTFNWGDVYGTGARDSSGGRKNIYTFLENPNFWENGSSGENINFMENEISAGGISGYDVALSILKSSGKIAGKTVFDHGAGTEWKASMQLAKFLRREDISALDFVLLYDIINYDGSNPVSHNVNGNAVLPSVDGEKSFIGGTNRLFREENDTYIPTYVRMERSLIKSHPIDPKDIVEFYSKDYAAALDGLSAYIPIIVGGSMDFSIWKVSEDGSGNETNEYIRTVKTNGTTYQVVFNKGEYVKSITGLAPTYFIGKFMRINVDISFKEDPEELNEYTLRAYTGSKSYTDKRVLEVEYV